MDTTQPAAMNAVLGLVCVMGLWLTAYLISARWGATVVTVADTVTWLVAVVIGLSLRLIARAGLVP
ncbi:hypothetical protein AB0J20_24150 [Micromonospora costi]|uniref:hypothetical protein n=1 Tax=Micromonospora costi TaxID=1530042 RepID=UPI0033CE3F3F